MMKCYDCFSKSCFFPKSNSSEVVDWNTEVTSESDDYDHYNKNVTIDDDPVPNLDPDREKQRIKVVHTRAQTADLERRMGAVRRQDEEKHEQGDAKKEGYPDKRVRDLSCNKNHLGSFHMGRLDLVIRLKISPPTKTRSFWWVSQA